MVSCGSAGPGRIAEMRIVATPCGLVCLVLLVLIVAVGGPAIAQAARPGPGERLILTKTGRLSLGSDGVANPGDRISYTFVVSNQDTGCWIDRIFVSDPMVSPINCPRGNPLPRLNTGEVVTCTGSYSITQADIDAGFKENTATAVGYQPPSPCGCCEDVIGESSHRQLIPHAAIALDKTGMLELGSNGIANPGDVITYSLEVTNTGNLTLHDVTLSDPKLASFACPSGHPISTMDPGESKTCTGTYALTAADITAGAVVNTADALGMGPMMQAVADSDSTTVVLPPPNEAPVALCSDVTVAAGSDCAADASVDAGSYDPDGDEITLTQEPPGPYGLGVTDVELTVSDGSLEDGCQGTVTVRDHAAPFVSCNAPPSISPLEVPISFTATGTDNCGLRRVVVRKPTCRRDWGDAYVQEPCHVEAQGDTLTILNTGRSTEIRWFAKAIDQSGNRIVRRCRVYVAIPPPPSPTPNPW